MTRYNKTIVAVLTAVENGLSLYQHNTTAAAAASVLGVILVYLVPNSPKAPRNPESQP